jgi:spore coat protein CotH
MNIIFRRNYKLIILFIVLFVALLMIGSTRLIAYNFGEGEEVKEAISYNYENAVDVFDDTVVHEITIEMDEDDYDKMIETYEEVSEKDYFHADITIDGVLIEDVGIRLKGSLIDQFIRAFNQEDVGVGDNPPFLIRFDEFIEGQTYQGLTEIALRTSSDDSLLNEQVAFYIHEQMGEIVPETSYGYVEVTTQDPAMYVICEYLDDSYLESNFGDIDGILYKAVDFAGFEYVGDDPAMYIDVFEQETNKNDDDLYYLIEFLKFVAESGDGEFEEKLGDWIDLDSFITMMVLDNLLDNMDSFVGMGTNYYLLYNKDAEQFTMLSWDQNHSLGVMENKIMEKIEDDNLSFEGVPPFNRKNNLLKERFFENEYFSSLYDLEYERLRQLIFDQGMATEKINQSVETFTQYNLENNIMNQLEYDIAVESIINFFTQ